MKIRSNALYNYLLTSGILNGTEEDIAQAKRDYRRLYKQQWKQRKRPRKEIRFEVTVKELGCIKAKAIESGLTHTAYARAVALSSTGLPQVIPNKPKLLKVLQLIGMAAIASTKYHSLRPLRDNLVLAETILLEYLKM